MNRNLLRPITKEELETYERDGVVWLPGILDPEWVKLLASTIEEVLNRKLGQTVDFTGLGLALGGEKLAASGRWSDPERGWGTPGQLSGNVLLDPKVKPGPQRGHYISATDAWKFHPGMRELALRSPAPRIAAALMKSRKVYLYGEQMLTKPPGTMEKTAWHSDQGYDHIQGEQVCGVRIPTTHETAEMGQVQYLKGSHKSGDIYKVNYFISDATDDDQGVPVPQIEGHEADFDIATFAPQPGDVVVHHLRTLHGAGGNASTSSTRAAVTIRYGGDDSTYKFRRFAPPQDSVSPVLKDGDPLDGEPERFPLAEL
jgi:Phytanoyl-CoA dioxygenase (PhyH)